MASIDEVKAGAEAAVNVGSADPDASKAADRAPALELSVGDEQVIVDATNLTDEVRAIVLLFLFSRWDFLVVSWEPWFEILSRKGS